MINAKSESDYLCLCKKMIGEKLGWLDSNEWKQRDFLNLVSLISEKSEITLSLSTIKRIWRTDYSSLPHPSTLDAFARFLDYDNWLDFKSRNKQSVAPVNGVKGAEGTKLAIRSNRGSLIKNKPLKIAVLLLLFIFLPGTVILLTLLFHDSSVVSFNPDDVEFSISTTEPAGVPNTVVFHYDVGNIDTDSFLVQQSWNVLRRDRIEKSENKFTTVYFYPGIHKARIMANDSVLKEVDVRIKTDGWLALARYDHLDDIPFYIRDADILKNGKMHVTATHLKSNNIDINNNTIVSYYFSSEFENLSSGNFTFESRLKLDSIFNYSCPQITICILGHGEMNQIPLTIKGCAGNSSLKIGNTIKEGSSNDLSSLGADVYDWQHVKIVARDFQAYIFLNDELVYTMTFSEDIGEISGINFNFTGTGIIDFVRLYNNDDLLVYGTDFEERIIN